MIEDKKQTGSQQEPKDDSSNSSQGDTDKGSGQPSGMDGDKSAQLPKGSSDTNAPKDSSKQGSFTQEEVEALLAKARKDEKSKVYGRVEELTTVKGELEKKIGELESRYTEAVQNLDQLRSGASDELRTVTNELKQLREHNEALATEIKRVEKDAELRVQNSELKAYRAEKIREKGVSLIELVEGDTREAIDSSIEKALKREAAIKDKLRQDVRAELTASLPEPFSPDGSQGRVPQYEVSPKDRVAIARLNKADFQKKKSEMLDAAIKKVGWNR